MTSMNSGQVHPWKITDIPDTTWAILGIYWQKRFESTVKLSHSPFEPRFWSLDPTVRRLTMPDCISEMILQNHKATSVWNWSLQNTTPSTFHIVLGHLVSEIWPKYVFSDFTKDSNNTLKSFQKSANMLLLGILKLPECWFLARDSEGHNKVIIILN